MAGTLPLDEPEARQHSATLPAIEGELAIGLAQDVAPSLFTPLFPHPSRRSYPLGRGSCLTILSDASLPVMRVGSRVPLVARSTKRTRSILHASGRAAGREDLSLQHLPPQEEEPDSGSRHQNTVLGTLAQSAQAPATAWVGRLRGVGKTCKCATGTAH